MGRFRRSSRRARPTRLFSGSPSSTFFPTPQGCPRTAVSTASFGRPGKRREGTCGVRRRGTTGSSTPSSPCPWSLRPGRHGRTAIRAISSWDVRSRRRRSRRSTACSGRSLRPPWGCGTPPTFLSPPLASARRGGSCPRGIRRSGERRRWGRSTTRMRRRWEGWPGTRGSFPPRTTSTCSRARSSGRGGVKGGSSTGGRRGACRLGLPILSFPQALAEYFLAGKESIVVAGTHGKTTATSLLAWSLFALEADPSFLVGGVPRNFPVGYRVGGGRHFVIEGDEYDTAYFDKGPKFLHYRPRIALLTSIEFDHADIYRDLPHLKESFRKLVRILPADGLLIASADYTDVIEVAREAACPVRYYGVEPDPGLSSGERPWRITLLAEEGEYSRFRMQGAKGAHEFRLRLPGRHNAGNAAAAALALFRLGYPADRIAEAF